MAGRGYAVFETAIGRCGIAWSDAGIVGVQLPEAREIETRARLFRRFPDARELPPPENVQDGIDCIAALLRGGAADGGDVVLDMTGHPYFNQRVYEPVRTIPRGETVTYAEIANCLHTPGAVFSVAQAIARNPFLIIVPCHRVVETEGHTGSISPHAGIISKRRLLSIDGTRQAAGNTLFDALLSAAPRPRTE